MAGIDFPRLKATGALLLVASVCAAAPAETLQYAVEWRLIPAGTAKLSWAAAGKSAATNGTPTATSPGELRLHLESSGLVSRLYRVSDDYTSVFGQNLCAENSLMNAREGSRIKETRVNYDYKAGRATWAERDLAKNSISNRDTEIPSCVHDVLGALMALRGLKLEPGKSVRLPVSDGKKTVQARVEAQEAENIRTPLGTFRAVRYEAFLFNDVLYRRPGHLHIWLTDDDRRLPVQIQVRLQFTIGTITLRLAKEESQ